MAKIEIEFLHDDSDCETCGGSYAEGAMVKIDGVVALEMKLVAHCFGGSDYQSDEVFRRVLEHLGHEVITS